MAWSDLDGCISALFTSYNTAFTENELAGNDWSAAWTDFQAVTGINVKLYQTIEHLIDCIQHIHQTFDKLLIQDITEAHWYLVPHTFHICQETFLTALTASDITNAWFLADLGQVKTTVAYMDYMKKAVWDLPYEIEWSQVAGEFWK